ncbi:MAG: hypothetical protein R3E64_05985 [Halioglobus sp.]
MRKRTGNKFGKLWHCCSALALVFAVISSGQVIAQSAEATRTLQRLTDERLMLTSELDQFRKTLLILHTDGTPPEQSANPAVRTLAVEAAALKERLIAITEQEVTLLQQQIVAAKSKERAQSEKQDRANTLASTESKPDNAMESKPLRTAYNVDYTLEHEASNVERLHGLLENYYTELQESARILPTQEELTLREMAQRDADTLNKIPFSVDKVRLTGSEGSTALAEISQRLMDPRLPESRRDIAPICTIKTRLFDTLVGSESRSLKPVGKNHYIARVRLQPGDTTISILANQWEVRLPQHADARDYLITLYRPVEGTPELHVFAVDELLTAEKPHIPAWLPRELDIKSKAG